MGKRSSALLAALVLLLCALSAPVVRAEDSSWQSGSVAGKSVNYVTVDMDSGVYADMMVANGSLTSTQSVAAMAQANGAFAAINGTYFSAYEGLPVPYGCIVRGGELLHVSGGAVGAFTSDGRFIVDRISWEFRGWCNGSWASTPWRMNHPSEEPDSITVFTPEYGAPVIPLPGGKTVLVSAAGTVTDIVDYEAEVPAGGFAISFGPNILSSAANYHIGDRASYTYEVKPTFTDAADWKNVTCAVGAGPSLVINGNVTADGAAEGFFEDKVNVYGAGRSFIGATADRRVIFGNIGNATLAEAAAVCQELGLVNAMCLDGGGSIALYYEGRSSYGGRDVNNALGFFRGTIQPALPDVGVTVSGSPVTWPDARPFVDENQRTMVPLRPVANAMGLQVDWDGAALTANFTDGDKTIAFPIGSSRAVTSDGSVAMTTAAQVLDGRTYAPVRYLAEYFGYTVDWDGDTRTVIIQ
ncbi:MAG: phosphodiester glycosidase family protein [Oscillospiraceae bacterium]|nr:phosphodiester glycosidase family protein [Oscillospiraceae bacterium]